MFEDSKTGAAKFSTISRAYKVVWASIRTVYKMLIRNWMLSVFAVRNILNTLFPSLRRISSVARKALTGKYGDIVKDGRPRPPIPGDRQLSISSHLPLSALYQRVHNKNACTDVLT